MGKIIFLDVDGTLVNYENQIPESAVSAIRKARENGHKVYICTGRSEAEVYDAIWEIGLDGMIGGNGSYVKDHDTVVMHQLVTADQCRRVVDWLHNRGLEFYLESNNGLFASEKFEEKSLDSIKLYTARKGRDAEHVTVRDIFPEMIFDGELYRDDVNKISFLLDSYQDHLDSIEEFPDLKAGTWGGAGELALFGDLGVKNIDKGNAIDVLLKYLGADIKDTYAFGDAKVDIPMLEKCNTGIAMENGGEEIKAAADYVTQDVNEDGICNAFRHFGLI
jgi:Cof subfamily protein (haloacid dehalogenase superfamily)